MTPRDLGTHRALIICAHPIEVMDLVEYLQVRGWATSIAVDTVDDAASLLADSTEVFALIVLATGQAQPQAMQMTRDCADEGCPILVVDGAASTVRSGVSEVVARPYMDEDLDRALASLGFAVR